jgi:hypothetical protein
MTDAERKKQYFENKNAKWFAFGIIAAAAIITVVVINLLI